MDCQQPVQLWQVHGLSAACTAMAGTWTVSSLYRAGTWTVSSLYRAGSLTAAARELARYKLDLVGVQEVRWANGVTVRAGRL
jgi:hypothetical protein